MDRRKIEITTEKKDDNVLINFNSEIDPALRKHSEEELAKIAEETKYVQLHLWARHKFQRNDDIKKYPNYENNYSLALFETKEVIEQLKSDKTGNSPFTLLYRAVPPYVCAVLLRDYIDLINVEEAEFCKEVILEYSSRPLTEVFRYQLGDGVDVAISTLPLILKKFPTDAEKIKEIILLNLFYFHTVRMSPYVYNLWEENSNDANAIFYGYLVLKPKFDVIVDSIREENQRKGAYEFSKNTVITRFKKECSVEILKFVSNQLTYNDIANISEVDPSTLVTAFLLLPLRTTNESHKKFLCDITPIIICALSDERGEKLLHYELGQKFLEQFSYFVLTSAKNEIQLYIQPFVELIGVSRWSTCIANLLREFVVAEDNLNQYDEFWTVWKIFYPKIVALCSNENLLRYNKVTVCNYLLALQWKEGAKEWHSLKDRDKNFFKKVSEEIGGTSVVLYSISKLLNDIGSAFASDGISWISNMLKITNWSQKELEVNTVYYLETLVRSYTLKNRNEIKTTAKLKKQILVILDFLLSKGSATAYLLREDIL